ncbi:MAG: MBL fold metallo-hydrolase [Pseudomonadota bacterium]
MGRLEVTVLGCGSSPGTPRPNGDWGGCDPDNPKNRRMRASILVERVSEAGGRTSVVIDTGPDFREQMLMAGVEQLDAVVYTHGHADHIHGIDDVRTFALAQGQMLPAYADENTFKRLTSAFGYVFETPEGSSYPPILTRKPISVRERFTIDAHGGELEFVPIYQEHGDIHSLGFRVDDFAYCSDASRIPQASMEQLRNLDVLIIDALQYREHVSHFSLREALEVIKVLEPKRAFLTHMHIPLDYETVMRDTPHNVEPCYDGLRFQL